MQMKSVAKEIARQRQLQAEAESRAARSSEALQQEAAVRQRMQLKVDTSGFSVLCMTVISLTVATSMCG